MEVGRRRQRERETGVRRERTAGAGRARKRRRVVVDTDSESDSEEAAVQGTSAGGAVPATLAAGRLAQGAGASGAGEHSAGFSFLSGSGGERHQAAVAEARRHLGGGGKRGWLA